MTSSPSGPDISGYDARLTTPVAAGRGLRPPDEACRTSAVGQVVASCLAAGDRRGPRRRDRTTFRAQPGTRTTLVLASENRGYTPPRSESLSLSLGVEVVVAPDDHASRTTSVEHRRLPRRRRARSRSPATPGAAAGFQQRVTSLPRRADRAARTSVRVVSSDRVPSSRGLRRRHRPLDRGAAPQLRPARRHLASSSAWRVGRASAPGSSPAVARPGAVGGDDLDGRPAESPGRGGAAVNLGDAMARWTRRWMSTLHRVAAPRQRARRSGDRGGGAAAYFHDGNADGGDRSARGGVGRPVVPSRWVADHIAAKRPAPGSAS